MLFRSELRLILLRDAEHPGDQPGRQRFGEFGDRLGVALGDHGVDEFVGYPFDASAEGRVRTRKLLREYGQ